MPKEFVEESFLENPILKNCDILREKSTELQRNVAEIQAAKYETALYKLMQRSGDNVELVNALNDFLSALDHQASFGDSEEPLSQGRMRELIEYFTEKKDELWFDVGGGGRPANRKATWKSKKEVI